MGLNIIGAGFGRTGTNSLRLALNAIGAGPCYHMNEVRHNPGHKIMWSDIAFGNTPDWDKLFENYQSAVDWPATHYWDQLISRYPDAKVILTVRDPDAWFKSFSNTIYKSIHLPVEDDIPTEDLLHRKMIYKIIAEDTFNGRAHERKAAIRVFNRRINEVQDAVHEDRLLIYRIKDGWEPLCKFLDVPVPDQPFPKTNTTADFIAQAPERYKPYMALDES